MDSEFHFTGSYLAKLECAKCGHEFKGSDWRSFWLKDGERYFAEKIGIPCKACGHLKKFIVSLNVAELYD